MLRAARRCRLAPSSGRSQRRQGPRPPLFVDQDVDQLDVGAAQPSGDQEPQRRSVDVTVGSSQNGGCGVEGGMDVGHGRRAQRYVGGPGIAAAECGLAGGRVGAELAQLGDAFGDWGCR